jgi:hypothetical protein
MSHVLPSDFIYTITLLALLEQNNPTVGAPGRGLSRPDLFTLSDGYSLQVDEGIRQ